MGKRTKVDEKRAQLLELVEMDEAESRYGSIEPVSNRSLRRMKSKRNKIKRAVELETRPESRFSIWTKTTIGSSLLILALFAIPISVGLLIMLATIPSVIQDLKLIPSTVAMVIAVSMSLLFVQSGIISSIVVYVARVRDLRTGTLITFFISLVSIMALLGFLTPIFRLRGIF